MAKTKISEFSATANSNTDINSINIAEGCAPSNINDAIRELMAELKDFQAGTKGDSFNGPVGTTTAAAGAFTTVSASGVITSTVSTGTAPLTIASTTKVTNLNADQLDGADWAAPASIGSTTPAAGAFTTLSSTGNTTLGDASGDTVTINGTVQPGVIVSGSSSSDALRITQTGAGNALLVEDAANPDATPFVIDTDGNAVFGNASTFNVISPQTGTSASTKLQYTATSGANNSTFAIANWSTSGTSVSGAIVFAKSKSGTVGSQTSGIVASGDRLGLLDFQGSDGTSFVRAARIEAEVDGTPGTGDMPGRLVFSTTADGASATTERMRLTSAGNLLVNTTSAVSGSKLVVASADATIYGITVGRGAGAVSTNTAVGASALAANTTGASNTTVGNSAGFSNVDGASLTAVGLEAGYSNTSGNNNVFMGRQAGKYTTTASDNTAIGTAALTANTTGASNVAIGRQALQANTTASNNTAVGYQSSYSNTTGDYLTSVGWQSLYSNTTGVQNVAMGRYTLGSNTTGGYNVAVGNQALILNTTASNNTAVGYQALYSNTTASNNVAVGYGAGYANTTGASNTFVGYNAGSSVTTSNGQTFIGLNAGASKTTGGNNTFVGTSAGASATTGTGNTFIGVNDTTSGAGYAVTTGSKNTIIGGYTGNQGGLDIRTASNYIVLSDGDGNPRGVFDGNGFVQNVSTTRATMFANDTLTLYKISNTSVGIALKGSDGVIRTATITVS